MNENNTNVGIYLSHEAAQLPYKAYQGDVGYDLYAIEDYEIQPGEMVEVKTGVHLSMPDNIFAQINTRSSYGRKGLTIHHGVIDSGYTGEVTLWISNLAAIRDEHGSVRRSPYTIKKGDRVAQLLFHVAERPTMVQIQELPLTERGDKYCGSSGQ